MKKSLNVVFSDKETVTLVEQDVPELKPHQVQCKAQKSLISTGTETLCLRGIFDDNTNWDRWVRYPFYPGYSMVAVVTAVGENVEGIKVGDRVVADAEHRHVFNVDSQNVYPVPEGLSDEEATWALLACTTQFAVRRAMINLGETVGIVGLGLLGQLVTQYVRNVGARHIIVVDPVSSRLEMATTHGATHALACNAIESIEYVKEITKGEMLDVVFDITGHPSVLAEVTPLVRKLGKVVLLGDTPTPSQQVLGPNVVYDSISILGSHISQVTPYQTVHNPWTLSQVISLFFDFLIQKRMNVTDLISHRFSPIEAPRVYNWLLEDRASAMGVIFDWSKI